MDNNQNNAAGDLAGILKYVNNFIGKVEKGNGFNLTDDQKKEYQKKFKEMGGPDKLNELKQKIDALKNNVKKANNNGKPD